LEDDETYDELDDDEDDDEDDLIPVVFYRVFDHAHPIDDISKALPWIMEDEDVIPTLSEVLANTPEEEHCILGKLISLSSVECIPIGIGKVCGNDKQQFSQSLFTTGFGELGHFFKKWLYPCI